MAENPCYKLDFSHCLAPDAFIAESIFHFFDTQFSLVKNGQQNWEAQHPPPKFYNPIEEAEFQERG